MKFNFDDIINELPTEMFDKLMELKTLRERPDFHPEESTFEHIKIVTNRAIKLGDADLIMAGIFHDIHKLDTMEINPKTGWPTSPGHDKWALKTIQKNSNVQDFIKSFNASCDNVAGICGEHMRIARIHEMRKKKQDDMRKLPFFLKLQIFTKFDDMLNPEEKVNEFIDFIINGKNR